MRVLIIALFLLATLAMPSFSGQLPMYEFLGSRRVIATIPFTSESSELGPKQRHALDRLAWALDKIDPSRRVVRLEGFCCDGEDAQMAMALSFERAIAVEDYIRSEHFLSQNRYLVGFGLTGKETGASLRVGRVEVALYDNIMDIDRKQGK